MIEARPGTTLEVTTEAGVYVTGLAGTLTVQITDNQGAITLDPTTDGIVESPAGSTIYAGTVTAPDDPGQYSIVWYDGSNYANEDLFVNDRFDVPVGGVGGAYATVEELAALLKVNAVTREDQLQRVLATAAAEIDAELGRDDTPFDNPPALVVEVNLERAVEHWQQMQSPFGIIGLGADLGATHVARDSWDRHALKLAPLKQTWGVA